MPSDLIRELTEITGYIQSGKRRGGERFASQATLQYAELVRRLLKRLEKGGFHYEYAPVLPNGMVIDEWSKAEPPETDGPVASRLVGGWEVDRNA